MLTGPPRKPPPPPRRSSTSSLTLPGVHFIALCSAFTESETGLRSSTAGFERPLSARTATIPAKSGRFPLFPMPLCPGASG